MFHKKVLLAIVTASVFSGCNTGSDPALVAENQQLKQQQATQASELQQVKTENDTLKAQQAQIVKDMAEIKAAVSAPPPLPSAAAPATPDATPEEAASVAQTSPAGVTQSAPQVAALKPSGADENKALEPGWIIETYPMKKRGFTNNNDLSQISNFSPPEEFSLGSFVNIPSPIGFLAHRKHIKGENHVQYRASGYFTVQNRGDHVFVLTLADKSREEDRPGNPTTSICNIKFSLEGQELVNDYVRTAPGSEFSINGGASLIEGLYQSQLAITCSYVGRDSDPELSNLGTISLTLAVRRPGAPAPTEFGERDIVYISQR